MIFTLILIGVTIALVYLYLTWNNDYWKKRSIPHNPPLLFFGNSPNAVLQKRNAYYDVQDVYK